MTQNQRQRKLNKQLEKAVSADAIALCVDAGANIDATDRFGETALMRAVRSCNEEATTYLLGAGADVNFKDKNGITALMCAAITGNASVGQLLLSHNAININAQEKQGYTALMLGIDAESVAMVRLLLAANADITLKNIYVLTALQMAENSGNQEIASCIKAATEQSELNKMAPESLLIPNSLKRKL